MVTVELSEFKITPADLQLKPGKAKFVAVNKGAVPHEFVLFPEADTNMVVEAHTKTMSGAGGHSEEKEMAEKAIVVEIEDVDGGKTKESAVIDLKAGAYATACFVPGHYQAGQKGKITVQAA